MKTFNLLDIMKSSTFGVPTPSDASVYDEGGNEDGQISRGDGNDDHYKPKKPIFLGSTLVAVLIDSKSPHLRRRFSHRKCSILKNLPRMALVNDKKKFFYFNAKHKKCTYCIGNGHSPEHGTVLFQSTDTHKAMSAVGMFHSSSSIRPELRNTLQEILEDEKPRKEMEELKIRKEEEEQEREDGEEEGKKKDTNSTIQHNLGDSPTTRTDVTSSEIKQSSKDKRKIGDRRRRGTIDKGGGNEEREEEPDFTDLMKKLVKASTLGFNELRNVSNSIKLPPLDVNRNIYFSPGETDNVSQNLMPESKRDRGYVAIATGTDGNCFFRSASLLICGNEDRHQEMRVRTVIELARNKHHYLSDPNIGPRLRAQEQYRFNDKTPINPDNVKVEAKAVEAEFETDLANICKNSVWASDWHFSALANILRCPVESVFPECGEQVGEYLNCVYQPKEEPLVIMWTRTESQGKDAKFEPNHFVPLVPNKMVRSLEKEKKRDSSRRESVDKGGGNEDKERQEEPGGGNEDEKRVEPDGGARRGSTSSDNKARKHGGEKEGQHTSTAERSIPSGGDNEKTNPLDYEAYLKDLQEASKAGYDDLYNKANSLRLPPLTIEENGNFPPSDIDENSGKLMPTNLGCECVALRTVGDGNCLFRAASKLAYGDESRHQEMRVRSLVELVCNKRYYVTTPKIQERIKAQGEYIRGKSGQKGISKISGVFDQRGLEEEFEAEVRQTCNDFTPAWYWHLHALATVFWRPVRSVFPEGGGQLDSHFNAVIHPREGNSMKEPLVIMWTSTGNWETTGPNHFVPLVPADKVHPSDKGLEKQPTCTSKTELFDSTASSSQISDIPQDFVNRILSEKIAALPFQFYSKICQKLDIRQKTTCNDYRQLGEEVGVDKVTISLLEQRGNATEEILKKFETTKESSVGRLKTILEEMKRDDVVAIIDEWILFKWNLQKLKTGARFPEEDVEIIKGGTKGRGIFQVDGSRGTFEGLEKKSSSTSKTELFDQTASSFQDFENRILSEKIAAIPYQFRIKICQKLDIRQKTTCNDYRQLGEEVGADKVTVSLLEQTGNATEEILKKFETTRENSVGRLKTIFEKMERDDVVAIINDWILFKWREKIKS